MGVTKTDYMRGMQCPKMLWLDKHKPEEKVIPPEVQERLDEGNMVIRLRGCSDRSQKPRLTATTDDSTMRQ